MYPSNPHNLVTTGFAQLLDLLKKEYIPAVLASNIGELCVRCGHITYAMDFFVKAIQSDSMADYAYNNIGFIYYQLCDYLAAEEHFYAALSINPANWDARSNLAELYRHASQLAGRSNSSFVHCPCCNGNFPRFIAGGPSLRPNAYCPRCGSLERHRLLCLYLKEKTNFFTKKLKVLHVAPEKILQDIFRGLPNLDYVSADIASPLAMIKMDITDIPFDDNVFDVIICSHVLEHIPDDRKAMRELRRVLKSDGWSILQVPIDLNRAETYEDPTITDPAERQRLFGQDDHVRWYGRDYLARLKEAGFRVYIDTFAREMTLDEVCRFCIITTEDIYQCHKHTT